MVSRSFYGSADLIRLLAAGGEGEFDRLARAFGCQYKSERVQGEIRVEVILPPLTVTATIGPPPEPEIKPRPLAEVPFWYAAEFEPVGAETSRRIAAADTGPIDLPAWTTDPGSQPAPAELVAWSDPLPRLRDRLAVPTETRRPDIPALVRRLGQGRACRRQPRRKRRQWGQTLTLIEDRGDRLIPHWQDQARVAGLLAGLFPRHAVRQGLIWAGLDRLLPADPEAPPEAVWPPSRSVTAPSGSWPPCSRRSVSSQASCGMSAAGCACPPPSNPWPGSIPPCPAAPVSRRRSEPVRSSGYGSGSGPWNRNSRPPRWSGSMPGAETCPARSGSPKSRVSRRICGPCSRIPRTPRRPTVSSPPWADAWGWDDYGAWVEFSVEGRDGQRASQRMRWIEPGKFTMGSPEDEPERSGVEGPRHEVTIREGFWLFDTACTQAPWAVVMDKNPSRFRDPGRPGERVDWNEVQGFMQSLNQRVPGLDLSLPSEAQWEYACRAGTGTALYTGPIEILGPNHAPAPDPIAWYAGNSGVEYDLAEAEDSTKGWWEGNPKQYGRRRVGTRKLEGKQANPWGLYDMLGNVWEWVEAPWYGSYEGAPADGRVWESAEAGAARVVRGGSWSSVAGCCRSAYRNRIGPVARSPQGAHRAASGRQDLSALQGRGRMSPGWWA